MRSWSLAALLLVALAPLAAYAGEERILFLKNGRSVRGELVEETETAYRLKVPGAGTVNFKRSDVVRVEVAQARPSEEPTAKGTRGAAPQASDPGRGVAAVFTGASAASIRDCRALLATAPETPEEEIPALFDRARDQFGVGTLLAILMAPTIKDTRAEIVNTIARAGDAAKVPIAGAFREQPENPDLLQLLLAHLDPSIEESLLASFAKLDAGALPVAIGALGEKGSKAALVRLVPLIAKSSDMNVVEVSGRAAAAIIGREDDRRKALAPYLAMLQLDGPDLDDAPRVTAAILVLAQGSEVTATAIGHLLHAIEHKLLRVGAEDPTRAVYQQARLAGYRAIAASGDPARVEQAIDDEADGMVRPGLMRCLLAAPNGATNRELIAWLIDKLGKPEDVEAAKAVLTELTQLPYGKNTAAWRDYLRGLSR